MLRAVSDVAARVALSLSACRRRARDPEQSIAIRRYGAVVPREAARLEFEALVFVTMGHTEQ